MHRWSFRTFKNYRKPVTQIISWVRFLSKIDPDTEK